MLQQLPEDVEDIIISFLIMPLDICKVKQISKYFITRMNLYPYVKNQVDLDNRARMIAEEYSDPEYNVLHRGRYQYTDSDLGDAWEEYHKWKWPEAKINPNYSLLWREGMYVDALDKIGVWGNGIILSQKFESRGASSLYKKVRQFNITFLGWADSFNEWVTGDKITFFGSRTINPRNKYGNLRGFHRQWGLYRQGENWSMKIIALLPPPPPPPRVDASGNVLENITFDVSTNVIDETTKKVRIIDYNEHTEQLITITAQNIDKKIRSVTNATVLLSTPNRVFNPLLKPLFY